MPIYKEYLNHTLGLTFSTPGPVRVAIDRGIPVSSDSLDFKMVISILAELSNQKITDISYVHSLQSGWSEMKFVLTAEPPGTGWYNAL